MIGNRVLGALSCFAWVVLAVFWGGFWRFRCRLPHVVPDRADPASKNGEKIWVLMPARNESDVIEEALTSLLAQDHPAEIHIVVVDDQSTDDTRARAENFRAQSSKRRSVHVLLGRPRPRGWAPKVWAQAEGWRFIEAQSPGAFVWLTDADIQHGPNVLSAMVAKARGDSLDLVSCMVRLAVGSPWERLLIPAFVFFFAKLYPFEWVGRPKHPLLPGLSPAAAAGGSMLIRWETFSAVGGPEAVRGALIDDCALARTIHRRGGKVWLGLGHASQSLRPYGGFWGVWRMVKRSAFTQLGHSWLLVLVTLLAMSLLYLAPVWGAMHGDVASIGAWLLMGGLMTPILVAYRQSVALGLLLPLAGSLYALMTLDSAIAHTWGSGVEWKRRSLSDRDPS